MRRRAKIKSMLPPTQRWVHGAWMIVFGGWIIVLTGGLSPFFSQNPGVLQANRLTALKQEKVKLLQNLESEIHGMKQELELIQSNRWFQEREVRRVLGFAAPNEIVFDFNTPKDGATPKTWHF